MTELKEIKSRWAGKCEQCGRDIKEGWTVYYDADKKAVYCNKCAPNGQLIAGNKPEESETCSECGFPISAKDKFCPNCGNEIPRPPTAEELLNAVSGSQALVLGALDDITEKLKAINSDIVSLRTKIDSLKTEETEKAKKSSK